MKNGFWNALFHAQRSRPDSADCNHVDYSTENEVSSANAPVIFVLIISPLVERRCMLQACSITVKVHLGSTHYPKAMPEVTRWSPTGSFLASMTTALAPGDGAPSHRRGQSSIRAHMCSTR